MEIPKNTTLTRDELIRSELEGKVKAIAGYDEILWKIRAGYLAILYGAIALFINKEKGLDLSAVTGNFTLYFTLLLLVLGFSLACFMVDFGYLRKKLKVIVARDLLIDIALEHDKDNRLGELLHIAGETDIDLLPSSLKVDFEKGYKNKRDWNLRWILMPLYGSAPLLVIFIYVGARN